MTSDRLLGLGTVAIALAYIASASQIQIGFLSDPVGSRTFPYIIGGVAVICGVYIALRPDEDPAWPNVKTFGRIGIALVVMYLFTQALKPFGFIVPAAIASAALSYLISPRLVTAVGSGIGLSIGLFLIFNFGLGLSLSPFGRYFAG